MAGDGKEPDSVGLTGGQSEPQEGGLGIFLCNSRAISGACPFKSRYLILNSWPRGTDAATVMYCLNQRFKTEAETKHDPEVESATFSVKMTGFNARNKINRTDHRRNNIAVTQHLCPPNT